MSVEVQVRTSRPWYREKKWKTLEKPKRPEVDRATFDVLHKLAGRSASEIARRTYVSAQTIRNWRNHKTRWPMHHTLAAVARVAGLSFQLVDDDGEAVEPLKTIPQKPKKRSRKKAR